jgi:hypothetical protein
LRLCVSAEKLNQSEILEKQEWQRGRNGERYAYMFVGE